jgi:hypothetical protein
MQYPLGLTKGACELRNQAKKITKRFERTVLYCGANDIGCKFRKVCCRQRGVGKLHLRINSTHLPVHFAYARVSVGMQFRRTDVLRSGPTLRSALFRSLQHRAVGNCTCTGGGTTRSEHSFTATLSFCIGGKLRAELSELSELLLYRRGHHPL